MAEDVFSSLFAVNVNGHKEIKKVEGKELTYLSWVYAWQEVKKRYPDAHYTIWKNENGLPYTEDPATGYMVYTTVTIDNVTHEMWLPVMNGANRAMKRTPYKYTTKYGEKSVEAATMMDINKAIMRCLVKNLAMFGLGLYIYAGEDLPEPERDEAQQEPPKEELPKPTERVAPKAEVRKIDKVPELSPEMVYLNNELGEIANEFKMDMESIKAAYKVTVQSLIKHGKLENKRFSEFSVDEIANVLDILRQKVGKAS